MSFRLAVVQPLTAFGTDAREQNLASARRHVAEAARQGAQLVCFPESYPGPWRMPVTWSPLPELREIARRRACTSSPASPSRWTPRAAAATTRSR
jgi:predicted amidohydrolase